MFKFFPTPPLLDELTALRCEHVDLGRDLGPTGPDADIAGPRIAEQSVSEQVEQVEVHPLELDGVHRWIESEVLHDPPFYVAIAVVHDPEVVLVDPKRSRVDLAPMVPLVAVRAERDQIFERVLADSCPRLNMGQFVGAFPADRASVVSLGEHGPFEGSRNRRPVRHGLNLCREGHVLPSVQKRRSKGDSCCCPQVEP